MMEIGVVKFFDHGFNKKFGFLIASNGDEIFFHLNEGRIIEVVDGKFCWGEGRVLFTPQKGDRLLFERVAETRSNYREKASPWGLTGFAGLNELNDDEAEELVSSMSRSKAEI